VANTSSAIKRIRSSGRKRQRNILVRSSVRTALKKAIVATKETQTVSGAVVKKAISELDRSVSKGVMHKNSAARRKSRLMKKYNSSAKS
jgi:small subunit ribosomal protein S20